MAKTILVVDDEKGFVSLIESALTQNGYRVLAAYDGEQAMQQVNKSVPDLILLDVRMPKMSGLAFYNAICLPSTSLPLCPVIVMTAHELMEDVFKDLAVAGFMTKPVKIEELLVKVNRIFADQEKQIQRNEALLETAQKKVMVVDDNPDTVSKISCLFLNEGYLVSVSRSADAISKLTTGPLPELILMRHGLPGNPMIPVASYLRSIPKGRHVTLIVYVEDARNLNPLEESELMSYVGKKNLAEIGNLDGLLTQCRRVLNPPREKKPDIGNVLT